MLRVVLLLVFAFLLYRAVLPHLGPRKLKAPPQPPPKPKLAAKKEERVGGKLPHEVLGVARDASRETIHDAYKRLVREHHPDKKSQEAPESRKRADDRTKEINRAYELLVKR